LLARDRRSLDILSAKKEATLSASEIPGVEEGKVKMICSIVVCSQFGSAVWVHHKIRTSKPVMQVVYDTI